MVGENADHIIAGDGSVDAAHSNIARNFGRSLAIPGQFCKRPSHFPRTRP